MNPLLQNSRRFLRQHPGQLLLALLGITAGVAVVTGVALLRDVLIHSLDAAADALAGSDSVRIEHPGGRMDEAIFADLATRPGAPDLVPILRATVRHRGERLELLAIDPLATAFGPMGLGGAATAPLLGSTRGILLNRATLERLGADPDSALEISLAGRSVELEIVAVLEDLPGLDQRLLMDMANAQDLLDRAGELSWIEAPASASAWLDRQIDAPLLLRSAGERRASAASLTAGMRANLTAMSLLAFAVGLFVIHAVLAFLLVQRRRQIAMLRAVGVTIGQLRLVLATETLILAGLGGLIGLSLGTMLADQLLELVRAPIAEVYGRVTARGIQPSLGLYLVVWLITLLLALASVTGLLASAGRIPPGVLGRTPDQSRTSLRPYWPALALALAGTLVLSIGSSLEGALVGLFLWLCVAALLAPGAGMRLLSAWHTVRRRHLSGRAIGMLGQARLRLAPALAALSLALGLSAGLAMMVLGFRGAVDDWVDRLLRADTYLTASTGIIDEAVTARINGWPEIRAVSSARQRELGDGSRLLAFDLPAAAWEGFEWLAGDPEQARVGFDQGRGVLISEPLARHRALNPGDRLALPTPSGPVELDVLAVYRDYGSERGVLAIDGSLYRELFADPVRDSLGLYLAAGAELEALQARLEELEITVSLTSREQVRSQTMAIFDRTFRISWALALLVALIALVALVSALLALGLERGRDYASLRALGLTRAGLVGWVVTQTTALAAVAALLAVPISLALHSALSLIIQPRAFGWSVPFSLPLWPWLLMLPLALLIGALAGLYPAWTIARRDPAPLLRSRS